MDRKDHLIKSLKKDVRFDGRKKLAYRDVKVEYGVSRCAEGSARVTLGGTVIMAGVKMELMSPYPDRPDEGNIMVNAELLPLSNPEFESGPPGEHATEIARVVDRGIRESGTIDVKKLCIDPGDKAWGVMIDIVSINDEGNLQDAAALAAIAALKDAKLPALNTEGQINYDAPKSTTPLPVFRSPVEVTVHKIGNHLFVDPLTDEEKLVEARLTVAMTENDNVCALQKGGEAPLSLDDLDKMIDIAKKLAPSLRNKL